jgi:hypothetical protein
MNDCVLFLYLCNCSFTVPFSFVFLNLTFPIDTPCGSRNNKTMHRFMQNQPHLIHLGKARLQLLEHLFLRSLTAQSSTNFIVIIRTDPNLHPSMKQPLIEMLEGHHHHHNTSATTRTKLKYLLVASNVTPKSHYHDILQGNIQPSMVWSGDYDSIMAYLRIHPPQPQMIVDTNDTKTAVHDNSENKDHGDRIGGRRLSMKDNLADDNDAVVILQTENNQNDNDNDPIEDNPLVANQNKIPSSSSSSLGSHRPPRILETRLDADDALHRFFVETLQALAVGEESSIMTGTATTTTTTSNINNNNNVVKGSTGGSASTTAGTIATAPSSERELSYDFAPLTWRIWCVDNHAEWQYQPAWKNPTMEEIDSKIGSLISIAVGYCITPGLSIAFLGEEPSIAAMPSTSKHEKLMHYKQCRGADTTTTNSNHKGTAITSNCRSFFPMQMAALRARTPTSAGMLNVVVNGTSFNSQYLKGAKKQRVIQDRMWYAVKRLFGGFSKRTAQSINIYMEAHMKEIATDNLLGQCTSGHSCKESSQVLLKSIVGSVLTTTPNTNTNTTSLS